MRFAADRQPIARIQAVVSVLDETPRIRAIFHTQRPRSFAGCRPATRPKLDP